MGWGRLGETQMGVSLERPSDIGFINWHSSQGIGGQRQSENTVSSGEMKIIS